MSAMTLVSIRIMRASRQTQPFHPCGPLIFPPRNSVPDPLPRVSFAALTTSTPPADPQFNLVVRQQPCRLRISAEW